MLFKTPTLSSNNSTMQNTILPKSPIILALVLATLNSAISCESGIRNQRDKFFLDIDPMHRPKQFFFRELNPEVELCLKMQKELVGATEYRPISTSWMKLIKMQTGKKTRMSSYRSDTYTIIRRVWEQGEKIFQKILDPKKEFDPKRMENFENEYKSNKWLDQVKNNEYYKPFYDYVTMVRRNKSKETETYFLNFNKMKKLMNHLTYQKSLYLYLYDKDVQFSNTINKQKGVKNDEEIEEVLMDLQECGRKFLKYKNGLDKSLQNVLNYVRDGNFESKLKPMFKTYKQLLDLKMKIDIFHLNQSIADEFLAYIQENFTNKEKYSNAVKNARRYSDQVQTLEQIRNRLAVILKLFREKKRRDLITNSLESFKDSQLLGFYSEKKLNKFQKIVKSGSEKVKNSFSKNKNKSSNENNSKEKDKNIEEKYEQQLKKVDNLIKKETGLMNSEINTIANKIKKN